MEQVAAASRVVVSVDAMGGDRGPRDVIAGLSRSARKNPDLDFLLHGPKAELQTLVSKKRALDGRVEIVDAPRVVQMEDKPSQVLRNGRGTSMWSAVHAVKQGRASVVVSCGNTGALMLLSMAELRRLPGVDRPAIAIFWPSNNPQQFNVVLDVGADVRAEAEDLLQFALMGAAYARTGLGVERPRVGLLNNGTEEMKGRQGMHRAYEMVRDAADLGGYSFVGFVEGSDMPSACVDVIVTDGFTGNIALKTAEGTASMIRKLLKETFSHSVLSRLAALLAARPLMRLGQRIDPRRANGGVFLGLQGTVVKSHGAADALSVSAAVKLAFTLAKSEFDAGLRARLSAVQQGRGSDELSKKSVGG